MIFADHEINFDTVFGRWVRQSRKITFEQGRGEETDGNSMRVIAGVRESVDPRGLNSGQA